MYISQYPEIKNLEVVSHCSSCGYENVQIIPDFQTTDKILFSCCGCNHHWIESCNILVLNKTLNRGFIFS